MLTLSHYVLYTIYIIFDDNYNYYCSVYSRDLRYKEMMMESMMKLPDDIFKQEILQYLTVDDIVNFNRSQGNKSNDADT